MSVYADDTPEYEALSYAWGDPEASVVVHVDGKSFSLTPDLAAVLRQLRRQNITRVLWIDQICINQQDLEERSAQVKYMMGSIYSRAKSTVIWLGEAAHDTHMAVNFMHGLCDALAAHEDLDTRDRFVYAGLETHIEPSQFLVPARESADWSALATLYESPWFRRLWVVQEAVLNDRAQVQCGNITFDLRRLERFAWLSSQHGTYVSNR